jgi:hypothetical protein
LDDASGDTQIEQRRTRRNDYQGGVTRRYESMPCAGRHIDEQDFNPAALCQRDTLLDLVLTAAANSNIRFVSDASPFEAR